MQCNLSATIYWSSEKSHTIKSQTIIVSKAREHDANDKKTRKFQHYKCSHKGGLGLKTDGDNG